MSNDSTKRYDAAELQKALAEEHAAAAKKEERKQWREFNAYLRRKRLLRGVWFTLLMAAVILLAIGMMLFLTSRVG